MWVQDLFSSADVLRHRIHGFHKGGSFWFEIVVPACVFPSQELLFFIKSPGFALLSAYEFIQEFTRGKTVDGCPVTKLFAFFQISKVKSEARLALLQQSGMDVDTWVAGAMGQVLDEMEKERRLSEARRSERGSTPTVRSSAFSHC